MLSGVGYFEVIGSATGVEVDELSDICNGEISIESVGGALSAVRLPKYRTGPLDRLYAYFTSPNSVFELGSSPGVVGSPRWDPSPYGGVYLLLLVSDTFNASWPQLKTSTGRDQGVVGSIDRAAAAGVQWDCDVVRVGDGVTSVHQTQ